MVFRDKAGDNGNVLSFNLITAGKDWVVLASLIFEILVSTEVTAMKTSSARSSLMSTLLNKDSTKLVYKQIKTKKWNQQKQENELERCFFLPAV